PPGPCVEAPGIVGVATLRRAQFLAGLLVSGTEVSDKIGVDAFCRQRIRIALIGQGLEFDATRAVQDSDARALPRLARSIACQADRALVCDRIDLLRDFGCKGAGGRNQGNAAKDASSADLEHETSGVGPVIRSLLRGWLSGHAWAADGCRRPNARASGCHPVQGADFVAVGIAQIGDVELHPSALADARRIFAGLAAMREASRVEGVDLFGGSGQKADGAAIGKTCGLAIDWL